MTMADKKATPKKAAAAKPAPAATATTKKEPIAVKLVDEPAGDHTRLATPTDEEKMRRDAAKPSVRKAALDAGKKDPLEKWGDPDAKPDQVRRATAGV
jgi:hypothetical protein